MLKNLFFLFLSCVLVVACTSDNLQDADEMTDNLIEEISVETRSGPSGCYELVFPISIDLPDGTSITAESMEEAKTAVRQWRLDNPDVEGRPHLSFPIELINEDGELITVESREDLREIRRECLKENYNNPKGKRCFRLVYPVTVLFPDGTSAEVADKHGMKMALREWKQNNPDAEERPMLEFPIEVEMKEDGSIVGVDSKEDLRQLKKDCN